MSEEVTREALKALRQARKIAAQERNLEALLAAANLGLQFAHGQSTIGEAKTYTVGFGGDHD